MLAAYLGHLTSRRFTKDRRQRSLGLHMLVAVQSSTSSCPTEPFASQGGTLVFLACTTTMKAVVVACVLVAAVTLSDACIYQYGSRREAQVCNMRANCQRCRIKGTHDEHSRRRIASKIPESLRSSGSRDMKQSRMATVQSCSYQTVGHQSRSPSANTVGRDTMRI